MKLKSHGNAGGRDGQFDLALKPLHRLYREVVCDYFARLGGSGWFDGYEDWHGAALLILSALREAGRISDQDFECVKWSLPMPLFQTTDGLPGIVSGRLHVMQQQLYGLSEQGWSDLPILLMDRHPDQLQSEKLLRFCERALGERRTGKGLDTPTHPHP